MILLIVIDQIARSFGCKLVCGNMVVSAFLHLWSFLKMEFTVVCLYTRTHRFVLLTRVYIFISALHCCVDEVKQFGEADFPPPVCGGSGDRRVTGCSEAACARRSVPTATLVESSRDDCSGARSSCLCIVSVRESNPHILHFLSKGLFFLSFFP